MKLRALLVLFVFVLILTGYHVDEVGHLRADNSLAKNNRSQPDFLHQRDLPAVEHLDLVIQPRIWKGT